MECVLELFCKYLEKCLWEHLFELCFSLSHGKKYCLNKCSKICSTPNIVLHALPSGVVSSYLTLRKEESQQKNFSQVRSETEQFPLSFFFGTGGRKKAYARYWERGHQKVSKQTGGIGCIKPQYSEDTYFMDGDS